jgi:hypothetical protein
MLHRELFLLLLLSSPFTAAQTQYAAPKSSPNGSQPRSQGASPNSSKTICPWLTRDSAASGLGGEVSVTVNVTEGGEGSCRFSRPSGVPGVLEILVSKTALPECPPGSAELKGIGNQAERCNRPGSHGESVEMIGSRVRDLHFTVTLASRKQKGAAKSSDVQDDALEQIAEQVAGNLY